ncbi:hypothetical protein HDU67_003277 [Dinochytrium kinnereticum]|nr:hypothetical protein HDU67_003277 [Dinochytrium kinnereticum]
MSQNHPDILRQMEKSLRAAMAKNTTAIGSLKGYIRDINSLEGIRKGAYRTSKPSPVQSPSHSPASNENRLSRQDIAPSDAYQQTISILKSFILFSSYPEPVLHRLASNTYELRRGAGQTIITKGDEGAEMFFLISGKVAVVNDNVVVSLLESGSFFGELGILISQTDCELLVLTKQKIEEAVAGHEELREKLLECSNSKEAWWKKQKYADSVDHFGGEFVGDIARMDLKKVSFFADASEAFIDELAVTITSKVYEKGSNIIYLDDESDSIYFIVKGNVLVIDALGDVHAEIVSGSVFGEVGVIMNVKRTASIRAKEDCYLLKLTRTDLYAVLENYSDLKSKLEKVAEERYALFEERSKAKTKDASECALDLFDIEVSEQSLLKVGWI